MEGGTQKYRIKYKKIMKTEREMGRVRSGPYHPPPAADYQSFSLIISAGVHTRTLLQIKTNTRIHNADKKNNEILYY